jgi:outer membrane immunogenic protein
MRRFLTGSILLLLGLLASPAMAADFPVKAPAYEAIYNWTGFYAGVNGGGSSGRSSPDVAFDSSSRLSTATASPASQDINGVLGGFQAGYNVQTGRFIFGLETDIQVTSQKGDGQSTITLTTPQLCIAPCVPPPPLVTNAPLDYSQKLPWFGTLRGRIGVTPEDRWFVYATGGLAYGEVSTSGTFATASGACIAPCTPVPGGSAISNFSQTRVGWVLGAGVEAALAGGWTGKVEYLHIDLGDINNTFAPILAPPFVGTVRASGRVTDEIVRVGLNYRFSGPAVAKY